jgi:hypothetical protein
MAQPEEPIHLSAQDARQGENVLRRPWERAVFLVGLIGAVLLGLVLLVAAWR